MYIVYCSADVYDTYTKYNPADVHWDVLNHTMSQYNLHYNHILWLKGLILLPDQWHLIFDFMSYSHQPPLQTSNALFPLLSNVSSSTTPSSLHAHLQTSSTSFPLLINGILFSTLHPTPIKLLSKLATPHFPSWSTTSHLQLHPPPPFVLISRPAVPHFPSWSTVSYFWLYVLLLSTSSPD